MKNKFLAEMQSRGYISQCTDIEKLSEISNKKSISGYIGFDCTASSLHVGSLLQIMILKLMQKHGHRPIVLLGGGTTLIGDPSGKDSTRKILKRQEINKNIKSILIIGSGPIVIGQACEFDYSGSQAARSLRDEGIEVSLINSNPAPAVSILNLILDGPHGPISPISQKLSFLFPNSILSFGKYLVQKLKDSLS